jgi:O-antigen ligase
LACAYTALYGLLAPWYSLEITGPLYDSARFLELILLISLAALLLVITHWRYQALQIIDSIPNAIKSCIAAFIILMLISSISAQFPEQSLQEASLFLLLFLFAIICQFLTINYRKLMDHLFIAAILSGALLFICHFVVSYQAAIVTNTTFSWITPFVSFGNVRFFSQYQAYTLPLLVVPLIALNIPFRWRAMAFMLLAIWWALHFATGTRSVWFALIVTALFMIMLLRAQARRWLLWQFFAMLIGGGIYLAFDYFTADNSLYGLGSITKRGLDDSGRWALWLRAFEMIKDHPLLGIGPMNFAFNNFSIAAHPHNSVLHIAAEYGLPAVLIAGYLVVILLKRAVGWCSKSTYRENQQINVALTASLACGLCDSLLSGNIIMPQSQVMLFMVGGWLVGRNQTVALKAEELQPIRNNWRAGTLIVTVLVLITIQLKSMQSYYLHMKGQQFAVPEHAHPRFWNNGHWPAEHKFNSSFSDGANAAT